MPTICEAKWLGKNIHEDSTHRLVTDEQIARWNINPDYNQNDETQPDYIKNRPCYTDGCVLINETAITGSLLDAYTKDVCEYDIPISSLLGKSIILGEKYIINVDGTEYPFTPWISSGMASDCHIGKTEPETMAPYGWSLTRNAISPVDFSMGIEYIDNISFSKSAQMGYEYIFDDTTWSPTIYLPETVPTTHNIKIHKADAEYHQLDEIYIPETIARKSYIDLTNNNYLDYAKITDDDGDHINIRNMPDGEYHIAFSELTLDNAPLLKLLKFSETSDIFSIIDETYTKRSLDPKYNNPKNIIINIKTTRYGRSIDTELHYQNITLDVYIDNLLWDYDFEYSRYFVEGYIIFPRNIIMKYSFGDTYNPVYDEDEYIDFTLDTIEGDVDHYPNTIEIISPHGLELDRAVNPGTYKMVAKVWPMNNSLIPFNPNYSTLTVTTTAKNTCVQRVFDTYNFCEYIRLISNIDSVYNLWTWADWAKIDYKVPDSCRIDVDM